MGTRIRHHIRSNVVGYVAIFLFAMSGTAFGLAGSNTVFSDDIVNQEVRSDDIENGGVGIADIGPNAVGSGELNDGSVKSAEINDGTIATVDIADGAVNSAKILDQSVTGTDLSGTGFGSNGFNGDEEIIDGTITGFDIAANQIGGGHVIDGSLSGPDIRGGLASGGNQNAAVVTVAGGSGTDVASTTVSNESAGQLLIDGSAELQGAEADEKATCHVNVDGSNVSLFYETTFDDIGTNNEATVSVVTNVSSLAPGAHTVTLNCISLNGTVVKDDAAINAIVIP